MFFAGSDFDDRGVRRTGHTYTRIEAMLLQKVSDTTHASTCRGDDQCFADRTRFSVHCCTVRFFFFPYQQGRLTDFDRSAQLVRVHVPDSREVRGTSPHLGTVLICWGDNKQFFFGTYCLVFRYHPGRDGCVLHDRPV